MTAAAPQLTNLERWLLARPFTEIRLQFYDACGNGVLPEARHTIVTGTFGSMFIAHIVDCDGKQVGAAEGLTAREAVDKVMKRAGDAGRWDVRQSD